MSDFERPMPSYRLVQTHRGDDLPAVAAREMGDANRWPELVWLNAIVHPYITTTESLASASVLLAGAYIKVPAPVGVSADDAGGGDGEAYERDCAMRGRLLVADASGDLAVLTGIDNLHQQLQHRLDTPRGQARRNPDYGCLVSRLKGKGNGPTAVLLAAEYVKATIKADYRVARLESCTAEAVGDSIRVTARAVAIEGSAVVVVTQQ